MYGTKINTAVLIRLILSFMKLAASLFFLGDHDSQEVGKGSDLGTVAPCRLHLTT